MRQRALALLLAAAFVGAPAGILRALCAGRSCERAEGAVVKAPFCSLPSRVRALVRAGFYEGRSPEILVVTKEPSVWGGSAFGRSSTGATWPSLRDPGRAEVPVVFSGAGVEPGVEISGDTRLDDIAPTIAAIIGLRRAHPEVRSGEAIEGVANGEVPRLVVVVVWRSRGTPDLREAGGEWPNLRSLARSGAATLSAEAGSLPLDPAAILTTIGTGGMPSQHGITGALLRNDEGTLVRAWGEDAPVSVIATLGDDLDERLAQRPKIGLVATDVSDRGLIGGDWYVDVDVDDVVVAPRRELASVRELLASGYGADRVPDLLAVVARGSTRSLDASLGDIVERARRAAGGSVAVVVTSTGRSRRARRSDVFHAERVVGDIELGVRGRACMIEAAATGGFFIDQKALARGAVDEGEILAALKRVEAPSGGSLFADAFSSTAVSFARYCAP